ncbi:MAG TPA: dihydrolipoamide acetyltransferase family protein, partial [Thermoclostridium sp.]
VIMPRQGNTVESCILTEWFVKKGDRVKEGDLLFSYETDKAAFEEESKVNGTVLAIFFNEGEDIPVLTNVCVIGEEGEDITPFIPGGSQEVKAEEPEKVQEQTAKETVHEEITSEVVKPKTDGERMFISPRARNLADKIGADIRFATPTGPDGRIIERDVRKLQQEGHLVTSGAKEAYLDLDKPLQGTGVGGRVTTADLNRPAETTEPAVEVEKAPAAAEYEEVKLTNIRKVIAKAMHESLSQMAQLTLNTSFDATEIIGLRQKFKANAEKMGLSNITLNDILIYAVSRVLPMHKDLNAHFMGDSIRYFKNVHMGVAVDTERGLMVPTLFNANLKSLNQIAMETKELAKACQKGTISPDNLKGGTFTITNLGALGIESFTPVINPPQTAILGVNTTEQKFRERNGVIESYTSMSLSLTFDHRAVDGAPAARFLKDLKEALENFTVLLAK